MKNRLASAGLALGLIAGLPAAALAQGYAGYGSQSYEVDAYGRPTLNVWGARVNPTNGSDGLLGLPAAAVGGATAIVGAPLGATYNVLTTGSVAPRGAIDSAKAGNANQQARPVRQYGNTAGGTLD
ncbi:hypothetical protein [Methylobacterium sp. A54F]